MIGIWAEEIESLFENQRNSITFTDTKQRYEVHDFCEIIHVKTAEVLVVYDSDFFAGEPAVTVNSFGKGRAYHIATRGSGDMLEDFYRVVTEKAGIFSDVDIVYPAGVHMALRYGNDSRYIFIMNFTEEEQWVDLSGCSCYDLINEKTLNGKQLLTGYGTLILKMEG